MGWVAREDHHQRDVPAEVADLMIRSLARNGVRTAIDPGSSRDEPVLIGVDNDYRFGLGNVIAVCRTEPADAWPGIIDDHVLTVVKAVAGPSLDDLAEDEVRERVRTKLVTAEFASHHRMDYARPVTEHLVLALAIDMPNTVMTIGQQNIATFPIPVDELFTIGQTNSNMEFVDEHVPVSDGINVWAMTGESHFIASQVADMTFLVENRIRSAPMGVVFGVPNRSVIFYTAPRDETALQDILTLVDLVASFANQYPEPPGRLSPVTYYWDGKQISTAGGRDENGQVLLDGSGAFGELIQRLGVILPDQPS